MTTNNNTLVHKYLVPLIENIDFDGCENNSNIKAVISKLMTIAKNTMKKEEEPGTTTDIKIDELKGAILFDKKDSKTDEPKKKADKSEPKKKADKSDKSEPKKKEESKKDTEPKKESSDQSDKSDENESSDDSSSPPKKQGIEKKSVRTPGKDDSKDDSDVDEVDTDNIDISANSDIDDPASDEE